MELGVVERKVLGALMLMANEANEVKTTVRKIAETIGYKEPGGAISFALRILERDNHIVRVPNQKSTYKVLG